jgi:hypothetical protein
VEGAVPLVAEVKAAASALDTAVPTDSVRTDSGCSVTLGLANRCAVPCETAKAPGAVGRALNDDGACAAAVAVAVAEVLSSESCCPIAALSLSLSAIAS